MIIQIYQGQTELRIFLARPQTGEPVHITEYTMLIIKPQPRERFAQLSPIIRLGEWGYPPVQDYPPNPHREPALIYPAFGQASDGATIFRLDSKLFRKQCGRYLGEVVVEGTIVLRFEIELNPHRYIATSVELNDIGGCQ
jgi:hypothetical protein